MSQTITPPELWSVTQARESHDIYSADITAFPCILTVSYELHDSMKMFALSRTISHVLTKIFMERSGFQDKFFS